MNIVSFKSIIILLFLQNLHGEAAVSSGYFVAIVSIQNVDFNQFIFQLSTRFASAAKYAGGGHQ
jgi:hypothetical protein